ncbi:unnamed protein product [Paramecium pentaurelia]|uniref:Helicase C-terminal domain-containing protein n=1 Tax=Paramecium pentaurelia TaxID=43138 RepID=A0A8S1WRG3_9CILI|nr:unnamed protein product [Paramecium pentaurelia]
MAEFRQGNNQVFIATDFWERGLDVQQVYLLINCDLPNSRKCYFHRINRSGRFGGRALPIILLNNQILDFQEILNNIILSKLMRCL